MTEKAVKTITKSVRFNSDESALIARVSRREHLPEGTFVRKLVLDGLARYRLEEAIERYAAGELNLGQAARDANVAVHRMMAELDRRGLDFGRGGQVVASLENLADLFGASPELHETIAELKSPSSATGNTPPPVSSGEQ